MKKYLTVKNGMKSANVEKASKPLKETAKIPEGKKIEGAKEPKRPMPSIAETYRADLPDEVDYTKDQQENIDKMMESIKSKQPKMKKLKKLKEY